MGFASRKDFSGPSRFMGNKRLIVKYQIRSYSLHDAPAIADAGLRSVFAAVDKSLQEAPGMSAHRFSVLFCLLL